MRKTVSVAWLKEKTNTLLRDSDPMLVEMRQGAAAVLEAVLFETDNYKGFRYLADEFECVHCRQKFGAVPDFSTALDSSEHLYEHLIRFERYSREDALLASSRPTDDTRREYF